jgi:hypothetical protein
MTPERRHPGYRKGAGAETVSSGRGTSNDHRVSAGTPQGYEAPALFEEVRTPPDDPHHRPRSTFRPTELDRGRRLRDDGMRAAALNTWTPWRDAAREALEVLAHEGREFCADDLVDVVGLPTASSSNALGPVFAQAARDGLIECVGFR